MKKLDEWLESREFYELMQTYRHTPASDIKGTSRAFNKIKEAISEKAEQMKSLTRGYPRRLRAVFLMSSSDILPSSTIRSRTTVAEAYSSLASRTAS